MGPVEGPADTDLGLVVEHDVAYAEFPMLYFDVFIANATHGSQCAFRHSKAVLVSPNETGWKFV